MSRVTWGLPLILAGLFLLLFVVVFPDPPVASTRAPRCAENVQQVERTRTLVQQGLDAALIEHTTRLFRVWLSTGFEGRERAAEGVRTEVWGYLYAHNVIEGWQIPVCEKQR